VITLFLRWLQSYCFTNNSCRCILRS